MRYMKALYILIFALICAYAKSDVKTSTKNGAFFAIGGSYAPHISYQLPFTESTQTATSTVSAPLYSVGIKYGAKHYFGNHFGMRLYLPLYGGYSHFQHSEANDIGFVAAGMGGDIHLDIGSSRGMGIFAGGEVSYAYYWLKDANAKGLQTAAHIGLSLHFHPRFCMQLGLKHYFDRPKQERLTLDSALDNYTAFVDFVFTFDNSDISHSYALREQQREKKRKEREAAQAQKRAIYGQSDSRVGSGAMGFFGGFIGSSLWGAMRYPRPYFTAPYFAPMPQPRLKMQ